MAGTKRPEPAAWARVRSAGVALSALSLTAVLAGCGSGGSTASAPPPSASTLPALDTSPTTDAAAAPPTTVVTPAPAPVSAYLGPLDVVLAGANLEAILSDSSTGTDDVIDLVDPTGVEVDPSGGYGQALVNLAGVGYQDDQAGAGGLVRLPRADALGASAVRAVLRADLSDATAVDQVTPDLLDVTFASDPLASLGAQVAQVGRAPGALPSANTGAVVTDRVDLTGGVVTEILGSDHGRSVTLSLAPGGAVLPAAP